MPDFSGPSARMNNRILTPPAESDQKTAPGSEATRSTITSSRSVSAIETLKQLKAELLQGNIDLAKSREVQLADRTITWLERGKDKDKLVQQVIDALQKKLGSKVPARTPVAEKPGVSEKKQQVKPDPADVKPSESESLAAPAAGNTAVRHASLEDKDKTASTLPGWKQDLINKKNAGNARTSRDDVLRDSDPSSVSDQQISQSPSVASKSAKAARPAAGKKPAMSADATAKPESGAAIPQWKQDLINKKRAKGSSADSTGAHGKQPVAEEKASLDVSSAQKTQASLTNDAPPPLPSAPPSPPSAPPPAPPPPPPAPPVANDQSRTGNKKIRSGGKEQSDAASKSQNELDRQINGENEVDKTGLLNAIKSKRKDYAPEVIDKSKFIKASYKKDYLKDIWSQMATYTVQDASGNLIEKYPLTPEGKVKYIVDRFSDFLFRQIGPQLMHSMESGNKELVLKLFNKAESIWVSNHAGGEGRNIPTSPWNKLLEKEQDKLSYGLAKVYLRGNHPLIRSAIQKAIEKVIEEEVADLKKTAGDDPEKMMQEAEKVYGIPREIRTEEQKMAFFEEFADVLLYAKTRSIKNNVLQPKDCSLKLLVPLITENHDEINRIRLILMARTTRQFNDTESEMREMHDSLVKMGYPGSYDDYVHRRFDL